LLSFVFSDTVGREVSILRYIVFLIFSASVATCAGIGDLPAPMLNQETFQSRAWTKADGLPQNSVTAVLQTRDGYLWIGTQDGLARFDGVHLSTITFPDKRTEPLRVSDLCEDENGSLWIGTQQQGLYSIAAGAISHYQKAQGLSSDSITSLATDPNGRLWIGTHAGLDLWNGKNFKQFTSKDGLPDDAISSVYIARSHTIWVTTRSGVSVFEAGRFHPYNFDVDSQGRSPEFLGVYEDQQHNLWAYGDTYLINLNGGKRFNYFRNGQAPSVRIWSFHEGRDGRLWIGTSGQGLFEFIGGRFRPVTIRDGRLPNDVRAICEDREGSLWLGTDGGGLIQLRPERIREFGAVQGLPTTPATCVTEDASGKIWVAFANGGLFYGNTEHFEPYKDLDGDGIHQTVRSISATPDGTLWAATMGVGLSRLHNSNRVDYTTANGLSEDLVTATGIGAGGVVWMGAGDGHLYHFAGARLHSDGVMYGGISALLPFGTNEVWVGTTKGRLIVHSTNSMTETRVTRALAGKTISSLCQDSAGRLWISTEGAGLACLAGDTFTAWNAQDGLPDTNIFSIGFDATGSMYLTCAKGIFRARQTELEDAIKTGVFPWTRLVLDFAGGEMTSAGWPATLLSRDGLLWFATGGGLLCFDPRGWITDRIPPLVYLESVRANNQIVKSFKFGVSGDVAPKNQPAKLPSDLHELDFEFTAPCLSAPEKVRFRYKVEGFDADWIEGNSMTRQAHYGSLPYGLYTFRVIACNPDGIWNLDGASFSFIISPPMWRARWALALYAAVLIIGVAVTARIVSHRRLRRRLQALEHSQEMARERMRIAQDMHDEIGSKLAKISFLSEHVKSELKDTEAHEGKVHSIANTSRDLLQSLDQMVWAVNPRNDTLEHLVAYLGHSAVEYFQNTSIECQLSLPKDLPDPPVSAELRHNVLLAFKEALANAMKHSGATLVRVEMRLKNGLLEITVSDNGSGFQSVKKNGSVISHGEREHHGLANQRLRLQSVGGEYELKSDIGKGTVVTFRVPVNGATKQKI
jgi:ligand-binding sensor domain-containing protein/signal transduction histidine kinase